MKNSMLSGAYSIVILKELGARDIEYWPYVLLQSYRLL